MKVLSVKQPWAYLLCVKAKQEDKQAIKDVENRTWKLPEKYKGERVLIHSSGSHGKKFNIQLTDEQMLAAFGTLSNEAINGKYNFGAIIGSVRFVDCTANYPSIWAEKTELDPLIFKRKEMYFDFNGDIVFKKHTIFNWLAADPILFDKPILGVKGKLGFWEYPADILICPYCWKVCLHDNSDVGVPNWGNPVHQCEHCKEMILESDYQILK